MLKIVAVLATLALAQAGPNGFGIGAYGHYGGYGAYGGAHAAAHAPLAFGLGHGHTFDHHHDKMPFLSCFQQESNNYNTISVNIKPRTHGYGPNVFGAGHAGLEATLGIYSAQTGTGKKVVIAFTEMADTLGAGEEGCGRAGYGNFIGQSSYDHDEDHTGHHGFGFGAFGHGYKAASPSIAKITLTQYQVSSVHIDYLEGFTSMSQLAGRGVIVCPADELKQDSSTGHWYCSTAVTAVAFPCCSLHYSEAGDTLDISGDRVE